VTRGRPQFQLGVARRTQLKQVVVTAIVQLQARHRLSVTPIEALGEPQDGRERPDDAP